MAPAPRSGIRADARENREQLLEVAGQLFAERGLEAPLYLIPKLAGVGTATLYRHFPDRHALLSALAVRAADMFADVARTAATATSGWDKIVTYIDGVLAISLRAPWVDDVLEYARTNPPQGWQVGRWDQAIIESLGQAQEEGTIRSDITVTDVVFLPVLLTRLVPFPEPLRSTVITRQRSLMLDSLRPVGVDRPPLDGNPLTEQLLQTITRPRGH